jgi:hypothetical protein
MLARALARVSEALMCPVSQYLPGEVPLDAKLLYDTLLVAWVLGMALLVFHLGRLVGATGWPTKG